MSEPFVSRGFVGKRTGGAEKANRIPPGQYLTADFPVLSAGPTPYTPLEKWSFSIEGLVKENASWSWQEFLELPMQPVHRTRRVTSSDLAELLRPTGLAPFGQVRRTLCDLPGCARRGLPEAGAAGGVGA